jgi:hypothetical protein
MLMNKKDEIVMSSAADASLPDLLHVAVHVTDLISSLQSRTLALSFHSADHPF